MNARQVHSVLAAGVQNPDLITQWQKEPASLLRLGVQPESLDLSRLLKFAGLTVKVRHNGVRQEFPMTFRLMGVAGLEIEIFAAYAAFCAATGRGYAADTAERTRELSQFLQHWLHLDRTDHSLLWDMFRHEQALALLNQATPSQSPDATTGKARPSNARPSAASVPMVCGRIVLHEMRCDPLAVQAALQQSTPTLSQIERGTHSYCYWRADHAGEIQILDLDEFGYCALSFVDGSRSVAELSRQLGGGRRPTPAFMRLLDQLASIGILTFAPASHARTR